MGVGAELRRARESRGLTVRDVADTTKIPSRQIDAIESERYEKLPGGIFGRGYVRAVAEALRIDADAIVRAYRDETEPERSAVPLAPAPDAREELPPRRQAAQQISVAWRMGQSEPRIRMAPADVVASRSPSKWLAMVLLGAGAILLTLWLGRDRAAPLISASRSVPDASAPARGAAPGAHQTPAGRSAPAAVAPRAGTETRGAAGAPTEQPIGTVGQASAAPPPALPGADGKPVDLLIVAERSSWLVLTVDGARIARRRLQPREAVHVRLRSRATLHTGDAGALKMSMNGGAFSPLGPSGAVRTIEITPPTQ